MSKHIDLLGMKATDSVTGFEDVITTMSFDLYGCIQAIVTPPANKDGEIKHGEWFDISRLKVSEEQPVMTQPNFEAGYIAEGKKGGAQKPIK